MNWRFWRAPKEPKSTHKVEIVPVVLLPHNNADSLSIVKVYGYQCVVRTEDWVGVDKAAYIQPDSVVPQRKEYEFLIPVSHGGVWEPRYQRITARKLRGERSEGLLMPAPRGSKIGDNVAERMGITRYVSPAERRELDQNEQRGSFFSRINGRGRRGLSFPGNERGPSIWIPVYDLENFFRYGDAFSDGTAVLLRDCPAVLDGLATPGLQSAGAAVQSSDESVQPVLADEVCITEKIHGCNARFVWSSADKRMFAGSRTTWKRPFYSIPSRKFFRGLLEFLKICKPLSKPATDDWNTTLVANPTIGEWCRAHPDHVLFGEIYGDVQDLKYGHGPGQRSFVGFDVFHKGEWWSWQQIQDSLEQFGVPYVPVLYKGAFNRDIVLRCVDGNTLIHKAGKQMREGCVIRMLNSEPLFEKRGYPGRKILKAVSSAYLERSSKDENPQPNVGG